MKKIIVWTLSLILISCTPQVTELPTATSTPSPTPIPTPTLHPEFVELQNLISDLSENLTLLSNGQIEENGVAIPNLQVDQNGKIRILVNGEKVAVNASDITFDDDGLTINGYELNENGEWEVAMPSAMEAVTNLVEQYNLDPEVYQIVETESGVVQVLDTASNKVVMQSDGSTIWIKGEDVVKVQHEPRFAVEVVAAASCQPTEIKPNKHNGMMAGENENGLLSRYFTQLFRDSRIPGWTGIEQQYVLIDRADRCWGKFYETRVEHGGMVLIYYDAEGVAQVVPIFEEATWEEIYALVRSR